MSETGIWGVDTAGAIWARVNMQPGSPRCMVMANEVCRRLQQYAVRLNFEQIGAALLPRTSGVTVEECQLLCTNTPGCACVSYERSTSSCSTLGLCSPGQRVSNRAYDTYLKLAGTSLCVCQLVEYACGEQRNQTSSSSHSR